MDELWCTQGDGAPQWQILARSTQPYGVITRLADPAGCLIVDGQIAWKNGDIRFGGVPSRGMDFREASQLPNGSLGFGTGWRTQVELDDFVNRLVAEIGNTTLDKPALGLGSNLQILQ